MNEKQLMTAAWYAYQSGYGNNHGEERKKLGIANMVMAVMTYVMEQACAVTTAEQVITEMVWYVLTDTVPETPPEA